MLLKSIADLCWCKDCRVFRNIQTPQVWFRWFIVKSKNEASWSWWKRVWLRRSLVISAQSNPGAHTGGGADEDDNKQVGREDGGLTRWLSGTSMHKIRPAYLFYHKCTSRVHSQSHSGCKRPEGGGLDKGRGAPHTCVTVETSITLGQSTAGTNRWVTRQLEEVGVFASLVRTYCSVYSLVAWR